MTNFDNPLNREELRPDSEPLFSMVLKQPGADKTMQEALGRLVVNVVAGGGSIQINSVGSEAGITIALPDRVIKLKPSDIKDPEQMALLNSERRRFKSGNAQDIIELDVATLRLMLMTDSLLKSR